MRRPFLSLLGLLAFFDVTARLEELLPKRAGLLGYTRRRRLSGSEGWTMTVWADDEALADFYYSLLHGEVLDEFAPVLEATRSCRFVVARDELPLTWERALAELERAKPWEERSE